MLRPQIESSKTNLDHRILLFLDLSPPSIHLSFRLRDDRAPNYRHRLFIVPQGLPVGHTRKHEQGQHKRSLPPREPPRAGENVLLAADGWKSIGLGSCGFVPVLEAIGGPADFAGLPRGSLT
jgi:hypothetical protein